MDEILGNYSLCSNSVKKTIDAIMLSLNEMSITDGLSNGILDGNDDQNTDNLILRSINHLIREHRNTFLPLKNNFTMENLNNSDYLKRSKIISRNKKKQTHVQQT